MPALRLVRNRHWSRNVSLRVSRVLACLCNWSRMLAVFNFHALWKGESWVAFNVSISSVIDTNALETASTL